MTKKKKEDHSEAEDDQFRKVGQEEFEGFVRALISVPRENIKKPKKYINKPVKGRKRKKKSK